MRGYQRTSKKLSVAANRAFKVENIEEKVPVIFNIVFKGEYDLFALTKDFTPYSEDDEVVL
jgi:hypothetical protein